MVPVFSSGTLTNVLPHRNAMPQTQDMTLHPVSIQTRVRPVAVLSIDVERHMYWTTQLPILMSWVKPDQEILPRPSTHTSKCSTL